MSRLLNYFVVLVASTSFQAAFPSAAVFGQFGGSRAGVGGNATAVADLPMLQRDVAEGFIAIDGRAEVRVQPTEIRIVLAITSEGETAQQCQATVQATLSQLKRSWTGLGIPAGKVVEDFIAVLPLYEWDLAKRGDRDVGIESKTGYRMQTNVHLAVANDLTASRALASAFEQGVTDIIAFDYWSKDLDDVKVEALDKAAKAARSKSDTLLTAFFDVRPAVINIQEHTSVHYPDSLYHSFVNSNDEEFAAGLRRDIPFIRAYRPRNTYYRGLYANADVQAKELPMRPEISVVSTVRLYFESPASGKRAKSESEARNTSEEKR